MAHELLQKRFVTSQFPTQVEDAPAAGGVVDFNATGDKFGFQVIVPIDVYRFGIITNAAMDPDAGGFVLALDKRVLVGSDAGRVEIDVLTRADAQTVAQGKVVAREVIVPVAQANGDDTLAGGVTDQTSVVNVGPNGPARFVPGDELILEVTNAVGAASTGYVWFEYAELPFDIAAADVIRDTTGQ
jgi:hypothetical protein